MECLTLHTCSNNEKSSKWEMLTGCIVLRSCGQIKARKVIESECSVETGKKFVECIVSLSHCTPRVLPLDGTWGGASGTTLIIKHLTVVLIHVTPLQTVNPDVT